MFATDFSRALFLTFPHIAKEMSDTATNPTEGAATAAVNNDAITGPILELHQSSVKNEPEAASAAIAASYIQQQQPDAGNKWNKNGYGAPVQTKLTGKFTKDESERVRLSIEQFCAAKQISVARLCSECDHKAELKGAWMEIAKVLPHRSVQSVYRYVPLMERLKRRTTFRT